MSAVSGSVASGHIVPKDGCAESVLQRPPLSRRGICPRKVAGRERLYTEEGEGHGGCGAWR